MTVRALPGVPPEAAADQLRARALSLTNVTGTTGDALARRHDYQRWAADTLNALAHTLAPSSLHELVQSPGYVMLHQDLATPAGVLMQLVDNEIARVVRAFEAAAAHLHLLAQRWADTKNIVVVDTSLLLHHERELGNIDWTAIAGAPTERIDLVVVTVVLEELDKAKDGSGRKPVTAGAGVDTRTRARRTLRFLADCFTDPLSVYQLRQFGPEDEVGAVFLHLDVDPLDHVPLGVADAELVDRAVALRDVAGARVLVATNDLAQSLRARMQGLDAYLHTPDA